MDNLIVAVLNSDNHTVSLSQKALEVCKQGRLGKLIIAWEKEAGPLKNFINIETTSSINKP